jgi:hypothetical protein
MRIDELAKLMNKTPQQVRSLLVKQEYIELRLTE